MLGVVAVAFLVAALAALLVGKIVLAIVGFVLAVLLLLAYEAHVLMRVICLMK